MEHKKARTNFFTGEQRQDLRRKMIDKYAHQFGNQHKAVIEQHVDLLFAPGSEINSTSIHFLEQKLTKELGTSTTNIKRKKGVNTSHTSARQLHTSASVNQNPDVNGHSQPMGTHVGLSDAPKVSGVDESQVIGGHHLAQSAAGEADGRLPQLTRTQLWEVQPINWKNDEERWGTTYKYNGHVIKQEQKLERLRAQQKKLAMKQVLEEQVREKERQHQKEKEQQLSFLNLNKQLRGLEKDNDERKQEHLKAKIFYEREMRQKQIEENRIKREREAFLEEERGRRARDKIQEELKAEKMEMEDLKQKKLEEMKRVMAENEERKQIMAERRELERLENIELQKKATQISIELERQRQAEFKAKADRISSIIKRYLNSNIVPKRLCLP